MTPAQGFMLIGGPLLVMGMTSSVLRRAPVVLRRRQDVARIAGLVRRAIESPIVLGGVQFAITPSIGIALYPDHGMSGQTLIAHADAAMYRAKQLRSPCEFFEPSMVGARPV